MEAGIVLAFVHQIGKFNLGLTTFKLANIQRLTREGKKKQIFREKRLLHYIAFANLEKTFSVVQKIFKLQAPNNN